MDEGRKRFLPILRNLCLELAHDAVGLRQPSFGGQPAGRFGQDPPQRRRQECRNGSDDEHPLPAPMRHHPDAHQRGDQDSNRKDRLEDEDEAAALLGRGELVHIGEGDRDLAAKSDALDEAKNH